MIFAWGMCGHYSLYKNLVHIDVCSLLALNLLLQWLWASVNWNICLHFCTIGVLLGTSHPIFGIQEHSHQWSFCRHYSICNCFLLCTYTRWIPDGLWRPGNSQEFILLVNSRGWLISDRRWSKAFWACHVSIFQSGAVWMDMDPSVSLSQPWPCKCCRDML